MKNTCLLSEDSKTYLCCFYQTLDKMVQSMTAAALSQSISRNFVVQTLPHHRAAIQMSNNVLRFTESPAVRRLAQGIVQGRTRDIDRMEGILDACGQLTSAQTDLRLYQRRIDLICRDMYAQMGCAPESNAMARLFLHQMIPHCLGAARMAENALKYDICTELVPILRSIRAQRRQEAGQMRALLSRMDCQRR